ncbi:hypothetical protein [Microbacterium sp. A84]|uniref:hypothetical protein n=1 Tax=Microbacterium sp. A84 TaxID=3450715 RepID=UPI003F42C378
MIISPGDLLHGDMHGVVRIPAEHARDLPAAIAAHGELEARVMAATRTESFRLEDVTRAYASSLRPEADPDTVSKEIRTT